MVHHRHLARAKPSWPSEERRGRRGRGPRFWNARRGSRQVVRRRPPSVGDVASPVGTRLIVLEAVLVQRVERRRGHRSLDTHVAGPRRGSRRRRVHPGRGDLRVVVGEQQAAPRRAAPALLPRAPPPAPPPRATRRAAPPPTELSDTVGLAAVIDDHDLEPPLGALGRQGLEQSREVGRPVARGHDNGCGGRWLGPGHAESVGQACPRLRPLIARALPGRPRGCARRSGASSAPARPRGPAPRSRVEQFAVAEHAVERGLQCRGVGGRHEQPVLRRRALPRACPGNAVATGASPAAMPSGIATLNPSASEADKDLRPGQELGKPRVVVALDDLHAAPGRLRKGRAGPRPPGPSSRAAPHACPAGGEARRRAPAPRSARPPRRPGPDHGHAAAVVRGAQRQVLDSPGMPSSTTVARRAELPAARRRTRGPGGSRTRTRPRRAATPPPPRAASRRGTTWCEAGSCALRARLVHRRLPVHVLESVRARDQSRQPASGVAGAPRATRHPLSRRSRPRPQRAGAGARRRLPGTGAPCRHPGGAPEGRRTRRRPRRGPAARTRPEPDRYAGRAGVRVQPVVHAEDDPHGAAVNAVSASTRRCCRPRPSVRRCVRRSVLVVAIFAPSHAL